MTSFWGHQDNPFPPDESRRPRCPVCGDECSIIYKQGNEILGCENCITQDDAWEEPACMEEDR